MRWLATASAAAVVVPGVYLWWVLLSPFSYQLPAGYAPVMGTGEQQVFVYGTLRNPLVRWLVLGGPVAAEEAMLPGYRRRGLDLMPAPAAGVRGELLTVQPSGLRRLDRYERLGIRYQRVAAELDDGRRVWVYRRLPQEGQQVP
ncbi:MAG: gamma-glutamylcyclotransferase family protein [Haliea sp.]|uniref:gamma-glutamylcyclotransferase family protein n=1 Tax=Haliea sp. TaxID=1932666 RepID=UPI0032EEE260